MAPRSTSSRKSAAANNNMSGGGCGCVGTSQNGGSMASDAVVDLVPHHAWASMDEQATNLFPEYHAVGGAGATASSSIIAPLVKLLNIPLAKGGAPTTVNTLILENLTGPLKKNYSSTIKKYSVSAATSKKLRGGGGGATSPVHDATLSTLDHVESLASFLSPDFTGIVSKFMTGGGASSSKAAAASASSMLELNNFLDMLTLSGAQKLGELLSDKSLFKSNKSIRSHISNAVQFASSATANDVFRSFVTQHGGNALDVVSTLSAANLDKVAALLGSNNGGSMVVDFSRALDKSAKAVQAAPKAKRSVKAVVSKKKASQLLAAQ